MKTNQAICVLLTAFLLFFAGCTVEDTISGSVRQCGHALGGVTVELIQNDVVVDTQTTDANGHYIFTLENSGDYNIKPVSPTLEFDPIGRYVSTESADVASIDFFTNNPNAPLSDRLQCVIDGFASDPALDTWFPTAEVPSFQPLGISAAVISPTHGTWHSVAGTTTKGGMPITEDMLFGAGSISKSFIAAMVLTYCEDPNQPLDLDDTIGCAPGDTLGDQCWFSEAQLPSSLYIPRDITVRELLFHKSGLRDSGIVSSPLEVFGALADPPTQAEYVKNHNVAADSKTYSYNNLNYTILGLMLEKCIGPASSVDEQMRNLFAQRAMSMPDTFMTCPNGMPSGRELVPGHVYLCLGGTCKWRTENDFYVKLLYDGITDEEIMVISGYSASVVTTANDLATWAKALYEDLGDGSSQFLSAANRSLMLQGLGGSDNYGAGVIFYDENTVGHGGTNIVYRSQMTHFLDTGETFAIMFNKDIQIGGTVPEMDHIINLLQKELLR